MQLENLKIHVLMEALVEGSTNRITFINHIIDYCKLFKHMPSNWQIKLVIGDPTRFSNIPKTCPVEPGHYFLRNFTSDLKYFPMKVIPRMKFFSSFEFFTIIKKRRIITSLVIKVYSELRYNNLWVVFGNNILKMCPILISIQIKNLTLSKLLFMYFLYYFLIGSSYESKCMLMFQIDF